MRDRQPKDGPEDPYPLYMRANPHALLSDDIKAISEHQSCTVIILTGQRLGYP